MSKLKYANGNRPLSEEEKQMFNHSVESVQKLNQLAQNFEK